MWDKLNEECAVFGISLNRDAEKEAAGITYNGLISLQHRGQESAGIAVVIDNHIICNKDVGLVTEVFSKDNLPKGSVAVGHTRYSTAGGYSNENAGPFVTEYLTGRIATAHNGNVTNAVKLRESLKRRGLKFKATTDSEVISSLIAYSITKERNTVTGAARAASLLKGAFSLIIASGKNKLIAIRDPNGYRPLCIGKNDSGYAVSSESCALDTCGFKLVRDVSPGEVVVIENGEIVCQGLFFNERDKKKSLCVFEYVYFARSDSVIDGLSVYDARYNMGVALADEYPVEADIVCGVPDSGLDAAYGYSAKSGIPLVKGFVKNHYIGRSFIYPTQVLRDNAVRLKLNPLSANIKDKRIVLIDDSIVRGTTSEKIVRSLKTAGAAEVHMRVSSPPFRYTCQYGTDIDKKENLIANKISIEEICKKIGADSLGYISMEGLIKSCGKCNISMCSYCFNGEENC